MFRAVQNEVMTATARLMRPILHSELKRPLVLVDRGGAPPPFVPRQYSVVPHHVVAQKESVAAIRAAFARSGKCGGTHSAGAGAGAGAAAGVGAG